MAESDDVVVVVNPTAGRGKAGKLVGKVDRLLIEAGVPHTVEVSDSATGLKDLAHTAAERGAAIVAPLGGDGTMGLVAQVLTGTTTALAPLPAGTGNDFAASMGIANLAAGIRAVAAANLVPIDVVSLVTDDDERIFINIAGCGFDSEVNEAANAMRLNLGGTGTYVAALVKTLSRFSPAGFRIELDDGVVEGRHMLVVVGNAISYGGGMKVTPDASVVDGVLDVCLLREVSTTTFLRAFPKVFRGTHVTHPAVTMARAKHVRVVADRRVMVYADGERVGPAPATFEVRPKALTVVVGPNAAAVR